MRMRRFSHARAAALPALLASALLAAAACYAPEPAPASGSDS